MKPEDFDKRMFAFLDGELSEEETRSVAEFLKESESARETLEFESRLKEMTRSALETPVKEDVKARVLHRFRREVDLEPAGRGGSILGFSWRMAALPIAASLIACLMWLGGAFDSNSQNSPVGVPGGHVHHGLVDSVLVSNRPYRNIRGERDLTTALERARTHKIYPHGCGVTSKERYDRCQELLTACLSRPDVVIPKIPERFEICGARVAEIGIGDDKFQVPHVIFRHREEHLSIYTLCGTVADRIETELTGDEIKSQIKGLSGCPKCGILVRRTGSTLLVFVSTMHFGDMQDIAEEI